MRVGLQAAYTEQAIIVNSVMAADTMAGVLSPKGGGSIHIIEEFTTGPMGFVKVWLFIVENWIW